MNLTLDAIARPSGTFAMTAMDQRESLIAMFDAAGRGRPDADAVVAFKLEVARALGPLASGFLIDREYGFTRVRNLHPDREGLLPASTGLILAADALTQEVGGAVEETELDEVVAAPDFDLRGVAALKLLVIWRRDDRRAHRHALVERFVAVCRERGVLSVLEPVVRATTKEAAAGTWDQEEAIREAARELSPLGQSLYKVQVPLAGRGDPDELLAASRRLDEAITGPWVVLSQGVAPADFSGAVLAACRAGASGFLAGRALWSDVLAAGDVPRALREISAPRLAALGELVDREARPWSQS